LKAAGRRSIPTEDVYFSQLPDGELQTSPEATCLHNDSELQVRKLCNRLKSPYCEIAVLYFCDQLTIGEISQKQGKNLKTVQTQLYRAKGMLKKLLAERSC